MSFRPRVVSASPPRPSSLERIRSGRPEPPRDGLGKAPARPLAARPSGRAGDRSGRPKAITPMAHTERPPEHIELVGAISGA